jgi:hypothetical protein
MEKILYNTLIVKHLLQFPKLLIFTTSIVLAYVLYRYGAFHWIEAHLDGASYLSLPVAGFFFSFGFTSPFATAYLIEIAPLFPPLLVAPLIAVGSMVADISIFQFTKLSLHDEIIRFKATAFAERIRRLFHHETVSERIRKSLRWAIAGIMIASPLPDEIGMTVVVGCTDLKGLRLSLLCFGLNTVGVLVILLGARGWTL